jgi:heme exporter protein B
VRDFIRPVFVIAWKDIMLELRTKDIVVSALVFALMVIVIFNFALNITPPMVDSLAPGILWLAFAFAGVLAMGRAFITEGDQGSLDGLLLCPVSRDAIFLGKMSSMFLFMVLIESLVLPIFVVLFNFDSISFKLIAIVLLGTLGFATCGTLFSSIAFNLRSREIMLPLLFFPVVTPIIIACVEASLGVITDTVNIIGTGRWIGLISVFDAIFLVLCPWAFGIVMEE